MDLQLAKLKRQIQWAELDKWRKKAYHSSKLYKGADEKMTCKRIKIKHFKMGK